MRLESCHPSQGFRFEVETERAHASMRIVLAEGTSNV